MISVMASFSEVGPNKNDSDWQLSTKYSSVLRMHLMFPFGGEELSGVEHEKQPSPPLSKDLVHLQNGCLLIRIQWAALLGKMQAICK